MGFYYRSTRHLLPPGEVGPVITPREYILLLSGAMRTVASCTSLGSDVSRSGARGTVAISTLIEGLSRRLQHRPEDASTHRMLGIAELHAGNGQAAIRHLTIAMKMLLAQTTTECLQQSLYARVELALLFPILMRLCLRLGRRATVRRLVGVLLSGMVRG
jgi:hypothetical protein